VPKGIKPGKGWWILGALGGKWLSNTASLLLLYSAALLSLEDATPHDCTACCIEAYFHKKPCTPRSM
jgi:hypothetical protein